MAYRQENQGQLHTGKRTKKCTSRAQDEGMWPLVSIRAFSDGYQEASIRAFSNGYQEECIEHFLMNLAEGWRSRKFTTVCAARNSHPCFARVKQGCEYLQKNQCQLQQNGIPKSVYATGVHQSILWWIPGRVHRAFSQANRNSELQANRQARKSHTCECFAASTKQNSKLQAKRKAQVNEDDVALHLMIGHHWMHWMKTTGLYTWW